MRFRERARASGYIDAEPLWADDMTQAVKGRLFPPCEFSPNGDIPIFAQWATEAAFCFGASQGEKLRACDDLNNKVNLCTYLSDDSYHPTHMGPHGPNGQTGPQLRN